MKNLLPLLTGSLILSLAAGCATSVDMNAVNRRIDDNAARLAALEEAQAKQDKQADAEQNRRIKALQDELEALRKDFADARWNINDLTEKVESFSAYRKELERFIAQFRKRGGEVDRALEEMTERLEADVRSLAEKLKEMLEEGSR